MTTLNFLKPLTAGKIVGIIENIDEYINCYTLVRHTNVCKFNIRRDKTRKLL